MAAENEQGKEYNTKDDPERKERPDLEREEFSVREEVLSDTSSMDSVLTENLADRYPRFTVSSDDENLDEIMAKLDAVRLSEKEQFSLETKPISPRRPESSRDFVLNFLYKNGMVDTMWQFQQEWYRLSTEGKVTYPDNTQVNDLYSESLFLIDVIHGLKRDKLVLNSAYEELRSKASSMTRRAELHRRYHRQAVDEKESLKKDLARLQRRIASFEPTLVQQQIKHDSAIRQKMLMSLARDRALRELEAVQAKHHHYHAPQPASASTTWTRGQPSDGQADTGCAHRVNLAASTTTGLAENLSSAPVTMIRDETTGSLSRSLPEDGGLAPIAGYQAHNSPINYVAFDSSGSWLATAADDNWWKLFSYPILNVTMVGDGHTGGVCCCDFHPVSDLLVTSSKDSTVKIWDFSKMECVLSLDEHQQTVKRCQWNPDGGRLVSFSNDTTVRVWDASSSAGAVVLRGHSGHVTDGTYLPGSPQQVLSCSADRTIILWDTRSGSPALIWPGNDHPWNSICCDGQGYHVAAGDTSAQLKIWDLRSVIDRSWIDLKLGMDTSINQIRTDWIGRTFISSLENGELVVYLPFQGSTTRYRHDVSVNAATLDRAGEHVLTVTMDGKIFVWP